MKEKEETKKPGAADRRPEVLLEAGGADGVAGLEHGTLE